MSHKCRNKIFVLGYPHLVGGAGPHCWRTAKLWRKHGVEVTFLPRNDGRRWLEQMDAWGCKVVAGGGSALDEVEGLPGSIVVAWCNDGFVQAFPTLQRLNCRTVWLGCMTWLFESEKKLYETGERFDRWVVNSEFQRMKLLPELLAAGYPLEHVVKIPSPYTADEIDYLPRPHRPGEEFVIGRLSRKNPDKWHRDSWSIYATAKQPLKVRCMGWSNRLLDHMGDPPEWVECLKPKQEPRRDFYASLHCLAHINDSAQENRPCTALEAMAYGVPVVAENQHGWKELIRHGRNGFLWNDTEEFAYYVDRLAEDEELRLEITRNARDDLVSTIANEEETWDKWRNLFETLAA